MINILSLEFQCGVAMAEHHRHRRLVGGAPALRGTWPWIAQVSGYLWQVEIGISLFRSLF